MKPLILTREERTQAILDSFRGLECEFYMLKGLLCLDGACHDGAKKKGGNYAEIAAERSQFSQTFNGIMIAERMDELRSAVRAAA